MVGIGQKHLLREYGIFPFNGAVLIISMVLSATHPAISFGALLIASLVVALI